MNISTLTATGTKLDLAIADAQGKIKFTKLPTAKPRNGEATANRVGGGGTRWKPAAVAGHANRRVRSGATH